MRRRGGKKRVYESDAHASILIEQAKLKLETKNGESFSASWLLEGGIGYPLWKTSVPAKPQVINISFDRTLADGSNLLDSENRLILEAIQKWAFYLRNGKITDGHLTVKRWQAHVFDALNFASWIKLHQARFNPEKSVFSLVTYEDCVALLDDICIGSWTTALQYKERLISHFHTQINYKEPLVLLLENQDNLDKDFIIKVCAWIKKNKLYVSTNNKDALCLSRTYLSDVIGVRKTSANRNLRSFLRQFEPHLQDKILRPSIKNGRLASQNMKTLDEIDSTSISERHFHDMVIFLNNFFKGHNLLPGMFPNIELSVAEVRTAYSDRLKRGSHTALIPLTIGLEALNQAAKWVLEFGPAIVDAAVYYAKSFEEICATTALKGQTRKKNKKLADTKDRWEYIDLATNTKRQLTSALNITSVFARAWRPITVNDTDLYRTVQALIGACVVVIGMLKPIRDREITHLPRNCLISEEDGGGTELYHEQGKSGTDGINNWLTRAIPSLSARAIQLLQVLGNQLSTIYNDDSPHSNDLFYFPGQGFKRPKSKALSSRVNDCLNTFCDMIEVPIDKHGRRWYIRIHEMRKFFLLITHRHGGDQLIDVLRFQAGHVNPDHIHSYIAPDAYDDLYIRYETECIEDKLISLEYGQINSDSNQGLIALYESTCKHFGVTSISGIPSLEYNALLTDMRRRGEYEVTTYSMRIEDFEGNVESLEFAIKYREKQDEKFNN